MSKIDELKMKAEKAREAAKEYERKAMELTKAEEAKLNSELLKAVMEWNSTSKTKRTKSELIDFFHEQAKRNREGNQ